MTITFHPYSRPQSQSKYSSNYSTTSNLEKNYLFNSQDVGNSDEETENNKIRIFDKTKPIKAKDMTIICANHNIKGNNLIKIVHERVQNYYGEYIDGACELDKDNGGTMVPLPTVQNGIITIEEPSSWIKALGGANAMMPSSEIPGYFEQHYFGQRNPKWQFSGVTIGDIIFPIRDRRLHITDNFCIGKFRVTTLYYGGSNKTDLTYKQIFATIDHIQYMYDLNDSSLARLQLIRLQYPQLEYKEFENELTNPLNGSSSSLFTTFLNSSNLEKKQVIQFIDYFNCLMFMVEASALNAALVTGIMTLELILKGDLTYKEAFAYNTYGGAYPYANTGGKSAGTYNNRKPIIEEKPPIPGMKNYRKNPDHSPSAVKEAIIIKNWLHTKKLVDPHATHKVQLNSIKIAIENLMSDLFRDGIYLEN